MTVGVTDLANPQPAPLVPPVDGALGQTDAERAAAAQAAAAAAAAISPGTTRAGALAEIEKMKGNPEFREKLLKGATAETKTWRDLHKIAALPETADENTAELVKRYSALQAFGLPGPDTDAGKDLLAAMSGKPISIETRRQVEAKRTALMADQVFVQKYLAGDQEARRVFATVSVLMAAQVERRT
jgi:hypothetical protein